MTRPGTVLIAGGLGALGRAIAQRVAGGDTHLALLGRRACTHRAVVADLETLPTGTSYHQLDLTDGPALVELISRFPDLRSAVFAAGVTMPADVLDATPAAIETTFATNTIGAIRFAQAAAKVMLARVTRGSILFLGSWAQDVPDPDDVIYGATKAATASFARGLALRLAPSGIRVNTLTIGIVGQAGMAARHLITHPEYADRAKRAVPLGRLALPDEVATAAAWLISNEASYITGASVLIDGGASIRPGSR